MSGAINSNNSSIVAVANASNANQRRRKGSISSVETSEESMDSDGDSNSVSRDVSPTNERSYTMSKVVQSNQIPAVEDIEENTIIIIDDSPDETEPVRVPFVSLSYSIFELKYEYDGKYVFFLSLN